MSEDDPLGLASAEAALGAFARGPAREAAASLAEAFEQAGGRISTALGRAVVDGETGFRRLAKVALEELAKIAIRQIAVAAGARPTPYFGARAAGGGVVPGGGYLVGERGPEWFVPGSAGRIEPAGAGGQVNVHIHLAPGAGAEELRRHHGQIAAGIARAVAFGRRGL